MTTQTDGAIGYVEYAYAKQNKMTYVLLTNKAARRSPECRIFPSGRGERGLGRFGFVLHHSDRPGRCRQLADHGRKLHPRLSSAPGSGPGRRSAEILCMGLQRRRQMAADLDYVPLARGAGRAGQEDLDHGHFRGWPRRFGAKSNQGSESPLNVRWMQMGTEIA
jgi:phosphate transport system substrate-binding protein